MTPLFQHSPMVAFLDRLTRDSTDGHNDAFMNEVMENGGSYVPPAGTTTSSHLFEISLHNVSAFGATEAEAIRNWIKAATAIVARTEDDGFITVHPAIAENCTNTPIGGQ
ncbi:hypothetical protein SAMN04488005_1532 [Yoonia tamlensis]|uniref:Uncharacterized protein n=1 Tax=Yoonia tamlensis TaxID=390270 RepID=A0A1I6GEQ7_9RHOB|nr:hypothetical protein [Yoonia tamlensis]SFR40638.1 hypothetical protein SAMN04488005_1532 [Yoonia tamlensis]